MHSDFKSLCLSDLTSTKVKVYSKAGARLVLDVDKEMTISAIEFDSNESTFYKDETCKTKRELCPCTPDVCSATNCTDSERRCYLHPVNSMFSMKIT